MCVCGISKPNQTKLNQTNQTKLNQRKPKTIYFLFVQTVYPNQTFSTINSKLTAWNKIKSKVPEKIARAAQLLYTPVLVKSWPTDLRSKVTGNETLICDWVSCCSSVVGQARQWEGFGCNYDLSVGGKVRCRQMSCSTEIQILNSIINITSYCKA